MRAAVFVQAGAQLSIEDVQLMEPGTRDVVVRIDATGLCHTDLSVLEGTFPGSPPMVLGHEGTGIVDWVGSQVTRVGIGDRVVLAFTPVCGRCWHCARDETHLCDVAATLTAVLRGVRPNGDRYGCLCGLGTFSEVAIVDETSCVRVQSDLPAEQLALIGCAVTTGVGAVLNTARVPAGDTVAVIGCGGVGQSVVQAALLAGASQVFAIDPVEDKRLAAGRFGADTIDPLAGDAVEAVRDRTAGRGVDFAFEAVGKPDLINQALSMTRRGGTTVLVGVPAFDAVVPLAVSSLVVSDRVIKGSFYGSARVVRDFPRNIRLVEAGHLDIGAMVSRRLGLDEINEGFDDMRSGKAVRSVIVH